MAPHTICRQQRLLLQLASASWRKQPQMRSLATRIQPSRCASRLQTQLPSRWPHNRHNFSTSSRGLQQIPPNQPFPTYFQDAPLPTTATPITPSSIPPLPPPPPEPKPKRPFLRRFLFASTFLLLGNLAGGVLERFVNPSPPHPAGSHIDDLQRQQIHHLASKLDVVQALEEDPEWISWDAYETFPEAQRKQHIISGSLKGSDALGAYQRVFQNTVTGEVLVLVYFGRGVTGWPTVVHGGALATVLDETCGRAAFARLGRNNGPGDRPIVTAWLSLDYLAMTQEREFYLVGARVRDEEELAPEERGKGAYKAYVEGWVESVRTGQETVVAEALFVGPKPKGEKVGVDDGQAEVKQGRAPLLPPDKRW
ncbi:HotDog domain-containing protein [Coniochaeta sp. 2T2.1]|nr:HotDog domain-containing protein [Coniochaeta sp. 2T2.1]